jgi:hypothetical protein
LVRAIVPRCRPMIWNEDKADVIATPTAK